jgi:hypothetical protein
MDFAHYPSSHRLCKQTLTPAAARFDGPAVHNEVRIAHQ